MPIFADSVNYKMEESDCSKQILCLSVCLDKKQIVS